MTMQWTPQELALGFAWYAVFLFSIVVHEAAHAFAALHLGDATAHRGGQVTLDPIPHIRREPLGMILIPILTFVTMGWAFGWASAPVNAMWAHRFPRRAAIVALAGPLSSLFLVLLAGFALRIGLAFELLPSLPGLDIATARAAVPEGLPGIFGALLGIVFTLNLILFVFNLIPVPPLDGSSIVPLFMGDLRAREYQRFMGRPGFLLVGIVVACWVFPYVFCPIHSVMLRLVFGGIL